MRRQHLPSPDSPFVLLLPLYTRNENEYMPLLVTGATAHERRFHMHCGFKSPDRNDSYLMDEAKANCMWAKTVTLEMLTVPVPGKTVASKKLVHWISPSVSFPSSFFFPESLGPANYYMS